MAVAAALQWLLLLLQLQAPQLPPAAAPLLPPGAALPLLLLLVPAGSAAAQAASRRAQPPLIQSLQPCLPLQQAPAPANLAQHPAACRLRWSPRAWRKGMQ